MKVLKTIVATAVIVFALTTVAMAGVQHFTKQSGQATGSQAQAAQPTYTVTLTVAQLAQLMNGGKAETAGGTQQHAKATHRHVKAARDQTSSHHASDATHASASGSGGTHHYEAAHPTSTSASSSGSHHAETGHHSGGGEGGSCGD